MPWRKRCAATRRLRHGRGGRGISGRLQGNSGPPAGIRRHARDRHADHRARFCRARHRCGVCGAQADRRVHDLQLRHAGDGSAHQFGGEDALHVRRPDGRVGGIPRTEWAGRARRRPAQPGFHRLVLAHPRPQGGRSLYRRRRQGPAQIRDPRSQSRDLSRERNPLRPELSGAQARRLSGADRKGEDRAAPAPT